MNNVQLELVKPYVETGTIPRLRFDFNARSDGQGQQGQFFEIFGIDGTAFHFH